MSLETVAHVLRDALGLEVRALPAPALAGRVQERLQALALDDVAAYARRLGGDPTERAQLLRALSVGETWFFRYPPSFAHLVAWARAHRRGPARPLRILSAPCATGEEPLSIAITLLEAGFAPDAFHVDAIDVCDAAIADARQARYRAASFRGPIPVDRDAHFVADAGGWRARPAALKRITYAVGNLLAGEGPPDGAYDAIFCRNLLIYLTEAARARLLARLATWLAPEGVLYVGHAEAWTARSAGFVADAPPAAFACRPAPAATAPPRPAPPRPAPGRTTMPRTAPPRPAVPPRPDPPPGDSVGEAAALADGGHLEAALRRLEAARATEAPSAALFHLLAAVHLARGRDDLARHALGRALYLDRDHVPSLVQAAVLAERAGDLERARRLRARAARFDAGAES